MDEKKDIINQLKRNRRKIMELIKALEMLDSGDTNTDRIATNEVTLTIFDVVEGIGNVEIDIYNYMRRRGHNELFTGKET